MKIGVLAFSLLLTLQAATQQQGPGVRVEGVALDGDTGKPLAGVVVQISGGLKVTTAADGKFAFISVPAGNHILLADKDGYIRAHPETRKRSDGGIDLTIVSGQTQSLVLHLFRAGLATGRIYDSKGTPVQGAIVTPYRYTYDNTGAHTLVRPILSSSSSIVSGAEMMSTLFLGRLGASSSVLLGYDSTSNIAAVRTNDLGEFRISNLDPGEWGFYIAYVAASAMVPSYYPGTSNPADAEIVNVERGVETRLKNMTIVAGGEAMLRVRVVNQTGQTNAGLFVLVRHKYGSQAIRAIPARADAAVEMGKLPPGSFIVEAVVSGSAGLASARAPAEMNGSDIELELPVPQSTTLSGRAITEPGNAESRPVAGLQIVLNSNEVLPQLPFAMTSGSDGAFKPVGLPAGSFQVSSVSGVPTGMCLNEIRQGDHDVMKDGLHVSGAAMNFTAILGASLGIIKGTVTDAKGEKISHAVIALVPDDRTRSDLYVSTISDQDGSFEIRCARNGAYHLFAWTELDGAAYRNAEFMKKFNDKGRAQRVDANANLTTDLKALDY